MEIRHVFHDHLAIEVLVFIWDNISVYYQTITADFVANSREYVVLAENIFELLLAEIFGLLINLLDKIFYQILDQWVYSTLLAQDLYGYIEISIICPT